MRIFSAGTRRRLRALGLAAGTLWAVCITAGSDTAAGAMEALGQALPLRALRWELGDLWYQDQLSPAVAVIFAFIFLRISSALPFFALVTFVKTTELSSSR